jgi:hypothetical protein
MSKLKLTGWYPGDQKPVRKGFYQVDTPGCNGNKYSYWNGLFLNFVPERLNLHASDKCLWICNQPMPNGED